MKKPFPGAFSLLELLITITCAMLIITPIMTILKSGAQSSIHGISRLDSALTGARILRQVRSDLKLSCLSNQNYKLNSNREEMVFDLSDVLKIKRTDSEVQYVFLSFPAHKRISEIIPGYPAAGDDPDKPDFRLASQISYTYNRNALRLTRSEQFPGEAVPKERVLSEQIARFSISIKGNILERKYFFLNLQIFSSKPKTNPPEKDNRILDFFDVAYSDFHAGYSFQESRRFNWHSRIVGPTEKALWDLPDYDN